MDRRHFVLSVPAAAAGSRVAAAESVPDVVFDGTAPGGPVRARHGVNGGPLAAGGLLDLSPRWKEAAFPLARLHDAHWPNPDVVDVHAIFPDPTADPTKAESYDFDRTDEYVKAVHDCGAAIVYRLGESIEHQRAKRHAHPPKDFDRWAAVCAGIVRHYTQGWAKGLKLPIKYWEVWNEPDNRPNCWTGTDDEYLRLYVTTAATLRNEFPAIKIGGPGLGNSGDQKGEQYTPTAFLKAFLARCKRDAAPLDFLSWHCYTADPTELVRRARGVRALLDASGFKHAESHLNEWNYLPDGSWSGIKAKESAARERWYARVANEEGAAFVAATLIALQDAPLDAANYFTAEAPGMGLFSQHGTPSKAFGAFLAFQELVGLKRLPGRWPPGVWALAGVGEQARVLLARPGGTGGPVRVALDPAPWKGPTGYEVLAVDAKRDLSRVGGGRVDACEVAVELPAQSVCLVRLWRAGKP
ncbi:GH39 family glycosyl hydrolase [Gemmata sp.]|uniref:GH39 family glycosyl hydrolase n=1 Tax=Gemmata sp. TaxID=1914242 RepID=UPI003F703752